MADKAKVRALLEFYFSDANLAHDNFLRRKITAGVDGYVSAEVLVQFHKLRALTTKAEDVLECARSSRLLEANAVGVRRKHALQPTSACDSRTVFVTPLAEGSQTSSVRELFSSHGTVECVHILRDLTPLGCLVVFSSKASAQAARQNPPPFVSVCTKAGFESLRRARRAAKRAASASQRDRANTALLCTRCFLPFNTTTRPPVALRCVHTLCLSCAENMQHEGGDNDKDKDENNEPEEGVGVQGEGEGVHGLRFRPLKCPACAVVTFPSERGFAMSRGVLEVLEGLSGAPSPHHAAPCTVCDIHHAATFKCEDCDELMCEAACAMHLQGKTTKGHGVAALAKRTALATLLEPDLCALHARPVALFCNDHHQPLCDLCREAHSHSHPGHAVRPLAAAAATAEEQCSEVLRVAREQAQGLQSTVATLRAERDRVFAEANRARESVNAYFDEIETHRQRLLAKISLTKKRASQLHADAVYHMQMLALRTRHLGVLLNTCARSKAQLLKEASQLREQLQQLRVVQSAHCASRVGFFPPVPPTVFNNCDVEPNEPTFLQRPTQFVAPHKCTLAVSLEGSFRAMRVVQVQVGACVAPGQRLVVKRKGEIIAQGHTKRCAPTTIALRDPVVVQPGDAVGVSVGVRVVGVPWCGEQVVRLDRLCPAVSDNPGRFVAHCSAAPVCFVCDIVE